MKAKQLLHEAQCLPCKVTLAISTSGSGQMQSLPMNELVKSQMDAAGFEVKLEPIDWNALLAVTREGVDKTRVRFDITVEPTGPIPDFVVKRASEIVLKAAKEGLHKQVMGIEGAHEST